MYASLHCRHQCAAIHPADRDEDEQERTARPRELQGDAELICYLYNLQTSPSFDPRSSPTLTPSCPSVLTVLTAAHTQKSNHLLWWLTNGTHIKRCLLLLHPPPLLVSPSGVGAPLLRSSQQEKIIKEKNNKNHKRSCNIPIENLIVMEQKKKKTNQKTFTWFSQSIEALCFGSHLPSFSLWFLLLFDRIWGGWTTLAGEQGRVYVHALWSIGRGKDKTTAQLDCTSKLPQGSVRPRVWDI